MDFQSLIIFIFGTSFVLFFLFLLAQKFYIRRGKSFSPDGKINDIEDKYNEQLMLFENIFKYSNTGMGLIRLDGRFFRANHSLCKLLGYSEEDMLMLNFYYLITKDDLNKLQISVQQLIENKIHSCELEQVCFKKNGETLWVLTMLSLIHDSKNKPAYFILQLENISLQRKAEERLRHMAYHDPLTGLANRNRLEQYITRLLAAARRHQQNFALLFLDLDHFKNINDTSGHNTGDMLLQIVAERLQNLVRNTDLIARLGGDEFVLLITDVKNPEAIATIAQKVLNAVLQTIVINNQEIYITTSIGISLYPFDGQNLSTLMKNADLALYRAKEQGRNNYQFYTMEMTNRAKEKLNLQTALGHALAKNEFFLHYQPEMEIKTRRIKGVEALLRWKNQELGAITPDEIISVAEETGLIIPISEWIFATAIRQLKTWHDTGLNHLTMAVNCSEKQFKQANFVDDVIRVVTGIGVPPQSLEIEVTESIIMHDPENTLRILYELKDFGVRIVIDDFGTGYWSLNNLRRMKVDKIKIDKTFIKQITQDETTAILTKAIIAMISKLGVTSIAEGVETLAQYDFLTNEGCTEIQGYYLSAPLSAEALTGFLKNPVPMGEVVPETF